MFMIYECNVCICKMICCIAEENKSLTAAGDSKSLIVEDEKSLATVGDKKFLATSVGNRDPSCLEVGVLTKIPL